MPFENAIPDKAAVPTSAAIGSGRPFLNAAGRVVVWLLGNLLLVVVVACVAFQLQQQGFNPVFLLSLLVGIAVGLGGAFLARKTGVRSLRLAVLGAIVFGLLTVVGQDYFGYLQYQRQLEDAETRDPRLALARAALTDLNGGFAEFIDTRARHDWWAWAWGLDALVTATSAAIVTAGGLNSARQTTQPSDLKT